MAVESYVQRGSCARIFLIRLYYKFNVHFYFQNKACEQVIDGG
jgi:hypothetical protein